MKLALQSLVVARRSAACSWFAGLAVGPAAGGRRRFPRRTGWTGRTGRILRRRRNCWASSSSKKCSRNSNSVTNNGQGRRDARRRRPRRNPRRDARHVPGSMRDLSDDERQAQFDEIRTAIRGDQQGRRRPNCRRCCCRTSSIGSSRSTCSRGSQRGGAAALTEGELAETLGPDRRANANKLEKRAEQVQQDLQDKISQLRLDARNQLLDVLTPEQRAKLESMMGDAVRLAGTAVRRPGWPRRTRLRLGGRGGRGGRGGGRATAAIGGDGGQRAGQRKQRELNASLWPLARPRIDSGGSNAESHRIGTGSHR